MILVCKDFTYENNSLIRNKLMSVNFDDDTSLPSSISREMDESSMNQYRSETNGFGITYTDTLNFEIHIMKEFDEFTSQNELEFTPSEYDDLVSWLSSPQTHKWLDIITENNTGIDLIDIDNRHNRIIYGKNTKNEELSIILKFKYSGLDVNGNITNTFSNEIKLIQSNI